MSDFLLKAGMGGIVVGLVIVILRVILPYMKNGKEPHMDAVKVEVLTSLREIKTGLVGMPGEIDGGIKSDLASLRKMGHNIVGGIMGNMNSIEELRKDIQALSREIRDLNKRIQ